VIAKAQGPQRSNIDYLEMKILEARQALLEEGLPDTDMNIAMRLPLSRKGQTYTREWINRKRNDMRRRGITVRSMKFTLLDQISHFV
jgi:hypothetical protein